MTHLLQSTPRDIPASISDGNLPTDLRIFMNVTTGGVIAADLHTSRGACCMPIVVNLQHNLLTYI